MQLSRVDRRSAGARSSTVCLARLTALSTRLSARPAPMCRRNPTCVSCAAAGVADFLTQSPVAGPCPWRSTAAHRRPPCALKTFFPNKRMGAVRGLPDGSTMQGIPAADMQEAAATAVWQAWASSAQDRHLSSSPAQAVDSAACAAGVAAGPRGTCAHARSAAGTPVFCKISPHAGTARCSAGCGAPAACAAGLARPALSPNAACVARRGARALRRACRAGFASRRRHAALKLDPCGTAAARRGARASEVRDAVLQAELVQAHGDLLGGRPLRRLQLHAVVDERRRPGAALVRHAAPRARAAQRHAQAVRMTACGRVR